MVTLIEQAAGITQTERAAELREAEKIKSTREAQLQSIPSEISQRSARINAINTRLRKERAFLSTTRKNELQSESSRLRGEITFFEGAKQTLSAGGVIDNLDRQATSFARTTSDFQQAQQRLRQAKQTKQLQPSLQERETESRRPETITRTELGREVVLDIRRETGSSRFLPSTDIKKEVGEGFFIEEKIEPFLTVEAVEEESGFFGRISSKFRDVRSRLSTEQARSEGFDIGTGAKQLIVGFGSSLVGLVESGTELITEPEKVVKDVGGAVVTIIRDPGVIKEVGAEIGRVVRQEPSFAVSGFASTGLISVEDFKTQDREQLDIEGQALVFGREVGIDDVGGEQLFTIQPSPKTVTQLAIEKAKFVLDPFESRTVIGGRLIPTEDVEKLDPSQQRLLFFAQPETILASVSFPRFEPVATVKFVGVKTKLADGKAITRLEFETTSGVRKVIKGTATGITEDVGKLDGFTFGRTDVIGFQNKIKFAGTEEGLLFSSVDDFISLAAGKIGSGGKVTTFKAGDIGTTLDDITGIIGRTKTAKGLVTSKGVVVDIAKELSSGVDIIGGVGGGTTTSLTSGLGLKALSRFATEAAVRASITPDVTVLFSGTGLASLGAATQSLDLGIKQPTPTVQKITPPPKIETGLTSFTTSFTVQQPKVKTSVSPKISSGLSFDFAQLPQLTPRLAITPSQPQGLGLGLGLDLSQSLKQSQLLKPSKGFGFGRPPIPKGTLSPFAFLIPKLSIGIGKIKKRPGKKVKKKLAPGFTGIITGGIGLPEVGALGVSPFALRGLPNGKTKKGRKALTDF